MSKYLTKGKQVAISAELEQNVWEDNNGVKHNGVQLNVNELFLLQSPKGEKESGGADVPQGKATEPGKDDVPF
jgi:single-stranded DNA-binding protein